jgi:hypothetical protein
MNRDSSVAQGWATGWTSLGKVWEFFLHHRIQTGSGTHPASNPMSTRGSFLRVKRPGRETDHSPPPSAQVKNSWSYASTPQYAFMARYSVKAQGHLCLCHHTTEGRCSSTTTQLIRAGIAQSVQRLATGWTTGRSWFDFRREMGIFSSLPCPDRLRGPPSLLSNGYRGLLPWWEGSGGSVKPTTHLHLLPRSKNARDHTSTLPIRLHGMELYAQDNFTFTFT